MWRHGNSGNPTRVLAQVIEHLSIRNFQSLRKVDLELGKLTVVVGASSSGKSAFVRSVRLLASNTRGSSYVTQGQKAAAVTAKLSNGQQITVERGDGVSKYAIGDQLFTKAGTGVPEQITAALRIQPDSEINFAGQFDRPFLLDESGSVVARVFGELTNVTTLFEAAREANRRRLALSGVIKTREGDLAQLRVKAQGYGTLAARSQAVEQAVQLLGQAKAVEARLQRLQALLRAIDTASVSISALATAAPAPIDLTALESSYVRLIALRQKLGVVVQAQQQQVLIVNNLAQSVVQEQAAHAALHEYLVEIGTCPTCGSDTTKLETL